MLADELAFRETGELVRREVDVLGALLRDEIESKKENLYDHSPRPEAADETEIQQTTQSYSVTGSGAKRQRVVTPASAKVMDVESEPRTSPSSRRISRGTMPEGVVGEGEKKVLGEIENLR